ncbi:3-keto-disaccharide hydrolase [Neorhodopirellula lusitana]|uniref:3-keto-disaccharide hydrolase n=1 Tax=Neorhodopirellula lusitana TaxID=445327 RepID=UPI00384D6A80
MNAAPRLSRTFLLLVASLVGTFPVVADPAIAEEAVPSLQGGEVTVLFDGKTLDGWRGREDLWSVEDGMIVGRTSEDAPIKKNTFLVLDKPTEGDFELTLQFKIEGGNSGIQYRSEVLDEKEFIVKGYQADIDSTNKFAGILYEERGRGILCKRGQQVTISEDGKKTVETFADHDEMAATIHPGEWNDYRIVARGAQVEQFINETMMVKIIDHQTGKARDAGVIALQLHQGPPMTIRYKNLSLRTYR